jgi:hypothetical protein
MIILGLVGGAFALAANLVAFEIIAQINTRVCEGERVDFFRWGTEIRKKHRALFPESKLVLTMDVFGALMIATFLILCWLVLHSG